MAAATQGHPLAAICELEQTVVAICLPTTAPPSGSRSLGVERERGVKRHRCYDAQSGCAALPVSLHVDTGACGRPSQCRVLVPGRFGARADGASAGSPFEYAYRGFHEQNMPHAILPMQPGDRRGAACDPSCIDVHVRCELDLSETLSAKRRADRDGAASSCADRPDRCPARIVRAPASRSACVWLLLPPTAKPVSLMDGRALWVDALARLHSRARQYSGTDRSAGRRLADAVRCTIVQTEPGVVATLRQYWDIRTLCDRDGVVHTADALHEASHPPTTAHETASTVELLRRVDDALERVSSGASEALLLVGWRGSDPPHRKACALVDLPDARSSVSWSDRKSASETDVSNSETNKIKEPHIDDRRSRSFNVETCARRIRSALVCLTRDAAAQLPDDTLALSVERTSTRIDNVDVFDVHRPEWDGHEALVHASFHGLWDRQMYAKLSKASVLSVRDAATDTASAAGLVSTGRWIALTPKSITRLNNPDISRQHTMPGMLLAVAGTEDACEQLIQRCGGSAPGVMLAGCVAAGGEADAPCFHVLTCVYDTLDVGRCTSCYAQSSVSADTSLARRDEVVEWHRRHGVTIVRRQFQLFPLTDIAVHHDFDIQFTSFPLLTDHPVSSIRTGQLTVLRRLTDMLDAVERVRFDTPPSHPIQTDGQAAMHARTLEGRLRSCITARIDPIRATLHASAACGYVSLGARSSRHNGERSMVDTPRAGPAAAAAAAAATGAGLPASQTALVVPSPFIDGGVDWVNRASGIVRLGDALLAAIARGSRPVARDVASDAPLLRVPDPQQAPRVPDGTELEPTPRGFDQLCRDDPVFGLLFECSLSLGADATVAASIAHAAQCVSIVRRSL